MKRKFLLLLLALTAILCVVFGFTACGTDSLTPDENFTAEKVVGTEGLEYQLSKNGTYYTCTGIGSATSTDITIASWYNEKWVRSIADEAFVICRNITQVTLSDSIASIGQDAFGGCSGLTSVTIGNGVTSISGDAFYGCKYLTSVYYTGDVVDWCKIEFKNESANPLSNNANLYINNELVTELEIPNSVTTIGDYAFYGCTSITKAGMWFNITTIGDYAFAGCTSLKNVTIPSDILPSERTTTIGKYAFYNCSSLNNVTLPTSLISIGDYAFSNCSKLPDIIIPDNVTSIGKYAFDDCYNLISLTIGESVESIGNGAFNGCLKLMEVYNFSNLKFFGYGAHDFYTSKESASKYHMLNDYLFYENDNTVYLMGYIGTQTELILPNDFPFYGENYEIYQYAFYKNSSLTSVTIENGITAIGKYAFEDCSSLTSVTIGNSVKFIGDRAFKGCCKLVEVYNLSNLTIKKASSGYGEVGYYALNVYTPTNGESKLHTVNDYIFYKDDDTVYLMGYVGNQTELTLPDKYNNENYEIYKYAFYNCWRLTNVTIGNGVTFIGDSAFSSCSGLTSVTIGNGVTSIGNSAFSSCSGLTSVTIGNSVTSIGNSAFKDCTNLTSVTIPNSVKSIEEYAFSGCRKITSVYYKEATSYWSKISIRSNNEAVTWTTWYYYSETEPTESGNYWHYDTDGVTPIIWKKEST